MTTGKRGKNAPYRNFLLDIFDTWLLLNQKIPKKIETEIKEEEIRKEREQKLKPRISDRHLAFSPSEVSIIQELVSDPRKSYVAMSNNLGLSRHTVKKKIEEMVANDKIQFFIGLNYKVLNLELMLINLEMKNLRALEEKVAIFQKCPRVFSIAKDISKNNLQLLFGIESTSNRITNQSINMIEKLQLDDRVRECTVIALYPELIPHHLVFMEKNIPQSNSLTPCEVNCSLCEKYLNGKCPGCPAFEGCEETVFNNQSKK